MLGAPAGGCLPAAAPLAAAAERPARLRAAGDDRRTARSIRSELAQDLAQAPIELVVYATDVSADDDGSPGTAYELAYSSHDDARRKRMAQALLASAAISALVLPLKVGDRIATDGGWVRNFPLGARLRPSRREPRSSPSATSRATRGSAIESLRACAAASTASARCRPCALSSPSSDEAEARELRGEPAHLGDMLLRLMRVTIAAQHGARGAARAGARRRLSGARRSPRRRRRASSPAPGRTPASPWAERARRGRSALRPFGAPTAATSELITVRADAGRAERLDPTFPRARTASGLARRRSARLDRRAATRPRTRRSSAGRAGDRPRRAVAPVGRRPDCASPGGGGLPPERDCRPSSCSPSR